MVAVKVVLELEGELATIEDVFPPEADHAKLYKPDPPVPLHTYTIDV
jgi:hypothetical protein